MFTSLSSHQFNVTPVNLTYVNPNRGFFNETTTSGSDVHFIFQDELSSVLDLDISFDSINILTNSRIQFSNKIDPSLYTVYTPNIPELDCTNLSSSESNFWISIPVESTYTSGGVCVAPSNILKLKNQLSEDHLTVCSNNYRSYISFNFGEKGLDSLKPELLYTTNIKTERYSSDLQEFVFTIPDWSDPIEGDDLSKFSCFGSIASDCPILSDNIKWLDSGHNEIHSWLKGDSCSAVWVERYYSANNEMLDTLNNANLQLLSGVEYTYVRPVISIQENNTTLDDVVFLYGGVSGDNIIDNTDNQIIGRFTF